MLCRRLGGRDLDGDHVPCLASGSMRGGDRPPRDGSTAAPTRPIDAPVMTKPLDTYRSLLAALPRPTLAQMEAFAAFVSEAHSWYKHLPPWPPGSPFQLFVDPGAGMQVLCDRSGGFELVVRETKGFHYSQLPTSEYRERFGFLAYSRSVGSRIYLSRSDGVLEAPGDDEAVVFDEEAGCLLPVPKEVLRAGRVELTAAVHRACLPGRWVCDAPRRELSWPAESGGVETLRAIIDRCRVLNEDWSQRVPPPKDFEGPSLTDYTLYLLMQPERERQLAEMVAAMQRVLAIAYGP